MVIWQHGAIEVIHALNDLKRENAPPIGSGDLDQRRRQPLRLDHAGSGVAAGRLGPEILDRKDDQGLTLADWLRRYGQDPARLTDARIAPGALAAFVELHIEQAQS